MPFVEADHGSLHYREWGSGPLAILVHGLGADHRLWDDVGGLLPGRHVVALDLAGCGLSSPVRALSLSTEALGEDLYRAIRNLGADAADVVGFSMGGFALLALWERHPEVVRSAALASARANADSDEQRAGRDNLIDLLLTEGRAQASSVFVPLVTADDAEPIVRARLRTQFESLAYETLVATLRGVRDRPDRMAVMETLDVPTLVVVGREDPLVTEDLAKEMVERAPDARLAVLPGAGHSVPLEAPQALAAELTRFWETRG